MELWVKPFLKLSRHLKSSYWFGIPWNLGAQPKILCRLLDFWGGVSTCRKVASFLSNQIGYSKSEVLQHISHFCSFTGFQVLQQFPVSPGQFRPIPVYLNLISNMAFEIIFLTHHEDFLWIMPISSLAPSPEIKAFCPFFDRTSQLCLFPIPWHFNASLAAYIALIAVTTPILQVRNLPSHIPPLDPSLPGCL